MITVVRGVFLILCLLTGIHQSLGNSPDENFFRKHAEGWFWYRDAPGEEPEEEETVAQNETASPKPVSKKLTPEEKATREVEAYKQEIMAKRNLALSRPTYANVAAYMRIQKEMSEKATSFAQTWQHVVLNEPDLNYERVYPTAQYARHIQDDDNRKKKESLIHNLSKEYGLFYFFKGGCSACEGFSPVVRMFSQKYSWDVMAISLDGSPNSNFEHTQQDNGMARELGIKAVPALVAYHSATGNLVPISYAMTSLDRLEDNIGVLTRGNSMKE